MKTTVSKEFAQAQLENLRAETEHTLAKTAMIKAQIEFMITTRRECAELLTRIEKVEKDLAVYQIEQKVRKMEEAKDGNPA